MIAYLLKQALEQQSPISIIYERNNTFSQRKIKIIKLNEDTIWAYCYYRKDFRQFKLKHILSVENPRKRYH